MALQLETLPQMDFDRVLQSLGKKERLLEFYKAEAQNNKSLRETMFMAHKDEVDRVKRQLMKEVRVKEQALERVQELRRELDDVRASKQWPTLQGQASKKACLLQPLVSRSVERMVVPKPTQTLQSFLKTDSVYSEYGGPSLPPNFLRKSLNQTKVSLPVKKRIKHNLFNEPESKASTAYNKGVAVQTRSNFYSNATENRPGDLHGVIDEDNNIFDSLVHSQDSKRSLTSFL